MTQEFDIVCLGGGVAGEAIAGGLQDSGLTLAVAERELVGVDFTGRPRSSMSPYWGCVPSKTLLRSGETLSEADRARLLAASRVDWTVDFPKVSKRVLWMARVKLVADRERGVLIGATLVTPRAGEIVGELVLAIKLRTPLKALADVIHPFPAFNRVLGATVEELAAKTAMQQVA